MLQDVSTQLVNRSGTFVPVAKVVNMVEVGQG